MNILKQLLIIFSLCLAGEVISAILPFAFPASVISLLLLFLLLVFKGLKPEQVSTVSDFLLGTMALYFIPAGVGIMDKYVLIKSSIIPLVLITIITTILTFITSGYTVLFFIKRMKKKEAK